MGTCSVACIAGALQICLAAWPSDRVRRLLRVIPPTQDYARDRAKPPSLQAIMSGSRFYMPF